jgi:hypothetical protein
MLLADEQKQQLYDDGYVKLPGVVPSELVDAALWAINNSLGEKVSAPTNWTSTVAKLIAPNSLPNP